MAGKTGKTREVVFSHCMYKLVNVAISHPKTYFKEEQIHKYLLIVCVVTLMGTLQASFTIQDLAEHIHTI